jgi:hypothetical protein
VRVDLRRPEAVVRELREIEDVILQLTGDLAEDLRQARVPPHRPGAVNFLFIPPPASPEDWLEHCIAEIVAAAPRRGGEPSRI